MISMKSRTCRRALSMRAFFHAGRRISFAILLLLLFGKASAGVDVYGTISKVWMNGDGTLYFQLLRHPDSPSITPYCSGGWHDLNMFVPKTNPDYSYLYGMILYAHSKQKMVSIANISAHSGQMYCDITTTTYGIIVFQ